MGGGVSVRAEFFRDIEQASRDGKDITGGDPSQDAIGEAGISFWAFRHACRRRVFPFDRSFEPNAVWTAAGEHRKPLIATQRMIAIKGCPHGTRLAMRFFRLSCGRIEICSNPSGRRIRYREQVRPAVDEVMRHLIESDPFSAMIPETEQLLIGQVNKVAAQDRG